MVAVIAASAVGRAAPRPRRDAEVEQLDVRRARRTRPADEHDVARLQIAVHDAGAVCPVDCRADLDGDVERVVHRQLRRTTEPGFEGFPFEKLEDQIVELAVAADVMDGADVRIVQRRDDAGFLLEALARFRIGRQRAGQDLDGHRAIQPGVTGAVDLAHAARADRRDDP